MKDNPIAWANALLAMPTSADFVVDLGRAVANDQSADGGARWLLSFIGSFLARIGRPSGPWDAFDFAIADIESLAALWPAFRLAAANYAAIGVADELPALARFIVERLPSIWNEVEPWQPHAPVTRALVLADRIDTLVGMFAVGFQPNGSKDPYALRRSARHVLFNTVAPFPIGIAA